MEYYRITVKDKQQRVLKEEYALTKNEAGFLQGFYTTDGNKAEITTLDTDKPIQQQD